MPVVNFGKTILPPLPPDILQAAQAHLLAAQDLLLPYLADLGSTDRRSLPYMGDRAIGWVSNLLSQMQSHPDLQPGFVDMENFALSFGGVGSFRSLIQPAQLLMDRLNDSYLVCSNEAYNSALACYQAVKTGARLKLPMAASIASELTATFPRRPPRGRARSGGNGSENGASPAPGAGAGVPPAA